MTFTKRSSRPRNEYDRTGRDQEALADGQLLPLTRPVTVDRQGGPPRQDVPITYPIDWYLFGKRAANMVVAAQRELVATTRRLEAGRS